LFFEPPEFVAIRLLWRLQFVDRRRKFVDPKSNEFLI
jgi:hypothetical protein